MRGKFTVVFCAVALFAKFGSSSWLVTLAMFVIVGDTATVGVTITVTVAVEVLLSGPRLQPITVLVIAPVGGEQVPWLGVTN